MGVKPRLEKTASASAEKSSAGRIISLVICALLGFALIMFFNYLEQKFDKSSVHEMILPDFSFLLLLRIFVAGIVGAVAMIIPGISGSLLLPARCCCSDLSLSTTRC